MWHYIVVDIENTIQYLSTAALFGFIACIIYLLWCFVGRISINKKQLILLLILGTYLAMILNIAYFSREPGSRDGLDLALFQTWGDSLQEKAYVIENVLLFIPMGLLLPLLWKRMQNIRFFTLVPLGASVSLEAAQYVMKRGYCQLDDVVTNVFGALIGFAVCRLVIQFKTGAQGAEERIS